MTNINKVKAILLLCLIFCCSCSDFLQEVSQDEIKPSTVDDLRALMNSEAYPYKLSTDLYLSLLTDEYQCNGLKNTNYLQIHQNGTAVFCWNPEMFDGRETFPTDANSWNTYYNKIKGCNVVKDYLSEVSGTEKEKNALLGQVLFLRAYYYMRLVMIYGQPYNGSGVNSETNLGVPLVLKMDVSDEYPSRNTLREVYDQIEADFLESATLLEANYKQESVFRVGAPTVYAMLSRFYLYRGLPDDMAKVVTYADKAIANGPSLTQLYTFESLFGNKGIYDTDVSKEAFWVYGSSSIKAQTYYMYTTYGNIEPYTISNDLLGLYDQTNDLRYKSYFYKAKDTSTGLSYSMASNKIGTAQINYGDHGIRIGEVYLNRAEALIRQYKATGNDSKRVQALKDLNDLRQSRYEKNTYTSPIALTDADDLLSFCLQERRRELCLEEGLRWFDIKRLGLSLTHTYIDTDGNSTVYTLKSGDLIYALPIPYDAIARNYKLIQNPR